MPTDPHNLPFTMKGRRALITGSSRGIGSAIAQSFARAGADVVIHYSNQKDEAVVCARASSQHGVKAVVLKADFAKPGAARRLFEASCRALGGIDILVLNASVQTPKNWLKLSRQDIHFHYEVNYLSSLELLQLAVPAMKFRKWGRILSIGSVQEKAPHPEMLAYSSLKNAQTAVIVSLARQLAPHGVTANNLAPGVIVTGRNSDRLRDRAYKRRVLQRIPAGRLGSITDCAGAALLLCSDAGSYITGQSLFVDGGMSLL